VISATDSDADRKRLDIMNKAAELFDELGYHDTNMERIALAAGLKKPTLYHYFRSKSQILFFISDRLVDQLTEQHVRRLATPMAADQMLLEMMADVLELMETHRGHVRVFLEFRRELPANQQADLLQKRNRYQAMLEEVLERGVAEGTFRQIDPRLTALGLLGMVNWAYQWFDPRGEMRPREIAYVLWDLVLRGAAAGRDARASGA
jgi:AcrR family transcriptional regulator